MTTSISPSRKYRVIMMTENGEQVEEIVTLPATLINNPITVENWFAKYVPAGHLLVEVQPAETVKDAPDAEPEITGYGDSLDFTGEEPGDKSKKDKGLKKVYDTLVKKVVGEEVDESEKEEDNDDDGESFVSFEPVAPETDL